LWRKKVAGANQLPPVAGGLECVVVVDQRYAAALRFRDAPRAENVTAEAAGVVVMDNSLKKVDEFMHISRRMRLIALQSAVGGIALSVIGMGFAATGHLSPVSGAITQEIIDVLAVLNALRAAFPPNVIHDL
jgi:cation transport ATPase